MNRKYALKLAAILFLVFFGATFFSTRVFGQAILTVTNQLIDPSMVDNYVYSPPGDMIGTQYDNDGYLAVGVGEFNRYNLVLTIDSPTPNLTLTIVDASICGIPQPGDYSDVDNPSDAGDTTTFVVGTRFDPIDTNAPYQRVVTSQYDCANKNRVYDVATGAAMDSIPIVGLTPLSDGRYGGYFFAFMTPRPGSHQNSFKLVASDPNANVGYVSEVVRRTRANPANAAFLNLVGMGGSSQLGINLTNVGQPFYGRTDFFVGMSVPCNSTTDNFNAELGFFDIDDPSGGPWEPPGSAGGYWQGTAVYPTVYLAVFEQPKAGGAWSTKHVVPIVGPGSGRNSEFRVTVGPFSKDFRYQFVLQNISRANAVQFGILDPNANLSTTAYEEPCGKDPLGFIDSCYLNSAGQTVINGWAYDNDLASGPQVQINVTGQAQQTLTANIWNYRAAAIEAHLLAVGGGTAAWDGAYGWEAVYNNLFTGSSFSVTGTALNAGSGANANRPLENLAFGPGGVIPQVCLFNPPPPTATLTINGGGNGTTALAPLVIEEGDVVNVSWGSTDATGCTASRAPQGASTWSGARATTGTNEPHQPDSSVLGLYRYVIVCNGLRPGTTASDDVWVRFRQKPNRPYFQVLNGDVSAGAGTKSGVTCTAVSNAPLATFNNGPPGYNGGGTGLAAFDLGAVTGFASGITNLSLSKPKPLTFANSGGGVAGAEYGGGFAAASCGDDYFNQPRPTALPWTGSFTTGAWNSGTTPLSGSIPAGNQVALYVSGNVYITGNITFASAGTLVNPTSFYLIVSGGNIYIDYRVTQIDGIYVAQNTNATNGKIFTCAVPGGGGLVAPSTRQIASTIDSNALYGNVCGQSQLVVNGALMAKQIKFLRSRAKVDNCTDSNRFTGNCLPNSAEIINYTPDIWLGPKSSGSSGSATYDAITSLPPVL